MIANTTIGTIYTIDGTKYYNLDQVIAFFKRVKNADFERYIRGKTLLEVDHIIYVSKYDVDRFSSHI